MDVKYVAHLARLALSPEEEEKFGAQLGPNPLLHFGTSSSNFRM